MFLVAFLFLRLVSNCSWLSLVQLKGCFLNQCIQGLPEGGLRRIILTASGGAFRFVVKTLAYIPANMSDFLDVAKLLIFVSSGLDVIFPTVSIWFTHELYLIMNCNANLMSSNVFSDQCRWLTRLCIGVVISDSLISLWIISWKEGRVRIQNKKD